MTLCLMGFALTPIRNAMSLAVTFYSAHRDIIRAISVPYLVFTTYLIAEKLLSLWSSLDILLDHPNTYTICVKWASQDFIKQYRALLLYCEVFHHTVFVLRSHLLCTWWTDVWTTNSMSWTQCFCISCVKSTTLGSKSRARFKKVQIVSKRSSRRHGIPSNRQQKTSNQRRWVLCSKVQYAITSCCAVILM